MAILSCVVKVLFACFKRADKREVKVAQLAGAVGELSAYHHGEQSLMGTIVNLAQVGRKERRGDGRMEREGEITGLRWIE